MITDNFVINDKALLLENILHTFSNELKYQVVVGSEIEFYSDNSNMQEAINNNFRIEAEKGKNQFEAIFTHSTNVVEHINNLINFQQQKNYNFQAKPFAQQPGSGLHFHINLLDKNGENIFQKSNSEESNELTYSIGGLCDLMSASMIFFAPSQSDYLRYNQDRNAPCKICFGNNNRSAAIRIPDSLNEHRRLEHRVCSSNADIYMSIVAILIGIYHGLTNKITPPTKIFGNAWDEQYNYIRLPDSLIASQENFKNSRDMQLYLQKFSYIPA